MTASPFYDEVCDFTSVLSVQLFSGFSVLYERYPRLFACLRRKGRLLLNDTDDQSVYDDVESRSHSFQADGGGFQSNDSQSRRGSAESLRSTSSIAWSLVTYFESGRRNSDSTVTYYSAPPCYIDCGRNRCRRSRSVDNLYENAHTDFSEHTYNNMVRNGKDGIPEYVNVEEATADSGKKSPTILSISGDSAHAGSLQNRQSEVQSNEENKLVKETSVNCDSSPCTSSFQNREEITGNNTAAHHEEHQDSSDEPNTRKTGRRTGGIVPVEDEYNALGVLDQTYYSVESRGSACDQNEYNSLGFLDAKNYSDYCFPNGTNDRRQEGGSFVNIASRSTSDSSLDPFNSAQEYDVNSVAMETCYVIESDKYRNPGNMKGHSRVSDEYTFLGHLPFTCYSSYDLNSKNTDESRFKEEDEDDEYATVPDKERSELDSICSIGSVDSIGSVRSIGSVNSVFSSFSSNSFSEVESVLESDEGDNGTNEYCNEWESVYDEIRSINENPFKDDSKQEIEKDYEMCSMKSMHFEEDRKSSKNNCETENLKSEKNTNGKLQSGHYFSEDENITEDGDFEMKTLRDDKANMLKLVTKNYFSQESNDAHLETTYNAHQTRSQRWVSKTELLRWNKLHEEMQKYKSFGALRKMLLQGKDDILFGFSVTHGISPVSQMGEIDYGANKELPPDAPEGLVPVAVSRDGNCFTRAISVAIYGTEDYHKILRTMILIEGVIHKHRYLNEDYLRMGTNSQQNDKILSFVFAEFSGHYKPEEMNPQGQRDEEISNTVEAVYKRDMLQVRKLGAEMGMWQIFQASNVLGRPIVSVFPDRGNTNYRNYFNRTVFPWNKDHRRNPPLTIMWTPIVVGGPVNHFVPLLPL